LDGTADINASDRGVSIDFDGTFRLGDFDFSRDFPRSIAINDSVGYAVSPAGANSMIAVTCPVRPSRLFDRSVIFKISISALESDFQTNSLAFAATFFNQSESLNYSVTFEGSRELPVSPSRLARRSLAEGIVIFAIVAGILIFLLAIAALLFFILAHRRDQTESYAPSDGSTELHSESFSLFVDGPREGVGRNFNQELELLNPFTSDDWSVFADTEEGCEEARFF
jgi:hypothetical protein